MKDNLKHKSTFFLKCLGLFLFVSLITILAEDQEDILDQPYEIIDQGACGEVENGTRWHMICENPAYNANGIPCTPDYNRPCCNSNPCHFYDTNPEELSDWYVELQLTGKCIGQTSPSTVIWRNNNMYWMGNTTGDLAECTFDVAFDFLKYQEPIKLKLTFIEKCHRDDNCDVCEQQNLVFRGIRHIYTSEKEYFFNQDREFRFDDFQKVSLWKSVAHPQPCNNCGM